jgi:hypothetical protein
MYRDLKSGTAKSVLADPVDNALIEVNQELNAILNDSSLSSDEKYIKYDQKLKQIQNLLVRKRERTENFTLKSIDPKLMQQLGETFEPRRGRRRRDAAQPAAPPPSPPRAREEPVQHPAPTPLLALPAPPVQTPQFAAPPSRTPSIPTTPVRRSESVKIEDLRSVHTTPHRPAPPPARRLEPDEVVSVSSGDANDKEAQRERMYNFITSHARSLGVNVTTSGINNDDGRKINQSDFTTAIDYILSPGRYTKKPPGCDILLRRMNRLNAGDVLPERFRPKQKGGGARKKKQPVGRKKLIVKRNARVCTEFIRPSDPRVFVFKPKLWNRC